MTVASAGPDAAHYGGTLLTFPEPGPPGVVKTPGSDTSCTSTWPTARFRISCLLSSASLHDSQADIPLATLSAERTTNLYDLMDAAYDAEPIRQHSRSLGHVPLIDTNPRRDKTLAAELRTEARRLKISASSLPSRFATTSVRRVSASMAVSTLLSA